jgi:hypothetical protein
VKVKPTEENSDGMDSRPLTGPVELDEVPEFLRERMAARRAAAVSQEAAVQGSAPQRD